MGEAFGEILPLAVATAASPVQVIAVVGLLVASSDRRPAALFVLGWLLALSTAFGVLVALPLFDGGDDPGTAAGWARVVLGGLLVAVAARSWRGRPAEGASPSPPDWMGRLSGMGARRALGFGTVLVLNPKILVLTAAAAVPVAQAEMTTGDEIVLVAAWVGIASSTLVLPVLVAVTARAWADQRLASLQHWLVANSALLTSVVLGLIGMVVIGKGLGIVL